MRRKGELPAKVCAVCGRPFTWRRKWARDWEAVRYCSERCRREAKRVSRLVLALVSAALAIAAVPALVWGDGPALTRCHTDQLRITVAGVPGGLDHLGAAIVVVNGGPRCVIEGYPGLDGITRRGQVVHASRSLAGYLGGATAVRPVVLDHRDAASALCESVDAAPPGRSCTRFDRLVITPPNDTTSVRRSITAEPLCLLQIHPVVPGRTGTQAR